MMAQADLIYLSGRKSTCVRGGLIATNNPEYFEQLKAWLPLYEGFITYGGMSSKEIEAMAVGLREMVDYDVASSSADLIEYFVDEMVQAGHPGRDAAGRSGRPRRRHEVPAAHPADRSTRPAPWPPRCTSSPACAAWNAARSRWTATSTATTSSPTWNSAGWPCRAASTRMSHMDYVVDRLAWLYEHRDLVGGLKFYRGAARAAVLHRQARSRWTTGARSWPTRSRPTSGRMRRAGSWQLSVVSWQKTED